MSLSLQCPQCKKRLKTKAEVAGKKIKCPSCETSFVASAAAAPAGPPPSPGRSTPARVGEVWAVDAHRGRVVAVALRGRLVFSAGSGEILLSDVSTGRDVQRLKSPTAIKCAALSPDGKWAASAVGPEEGPGEVHLWDLCTGIIVRRLSGHEKTVNAVAFSPDSKTLASGSDDLTVRVWDVHGGKELHRFSTDSGLHPFVLCVAYSPDGSLLAAGTLVNNHEKTIWVWDLAEGERIEIEKGIFHTQGVEPSILGLSFLPDGDELVAAVEDCTVRTWDVESQEFEVTLASGFLSTTTHKSTVRGIASSRDGRWVASVGDDNTFRLWDMNSYKQIHCFTTPTAQTCVSFAPNKRYAATGGQDGSLRLWGMPADEAR